MAEAIRYAVVGLGRAGWNIHIKQLRERADAKVVAVTDPAIERMDQAKAELGCETYSDLKKLLKRSDAEVVVIASPSARHSPDAKACFAAGRHVVMEKPMATTLSAADRMIAQAEAAGKKLFIHQNYRFRDEFLIMKEVVASGKIGRVYHIRMYVSSFARRNDWQTLSKYGGGLLNNAGAHYLDQIIQLLPGRVAEVMGDLQQIVSAGDVEDHVKALLRTDAGSTADLEVSTAQNIAMPLPKWTLCGTTGTYTADGVNYTLRWFDPNQIEPLVPIEGAAPDRRYGNDDKLPWQEKTGVVAEAKSIGTFYDNVWSVLREGGEMVCRPEQVREVMRVMQMVKKSARRTV